MIARYIQGIRIYCPDCKKQVTPTMIIQNDDDGLTRVIEFHCDCGYIAPRLVLCKP